MSIDINWETITSGPDGDALAESIRSFIHDKFQQISLPGFIRSVEVHSFDFGKICPELEIKDIGDPLPDFYDDGADGEDEIEEDQAGQPIHHLDSTPSESVQNDRPPDHAGSQKQDVNSASTHEDPRSRPIPPSISTTLPLSRPPFNLADQHASPFPRSGTPGIPGGTSNLSYFHLPLGGISGTQTPLAAVASGTPFPTGWIDALYATDARQRQPEKDNGSPTRPSTATSLLGPQSLGEDLGLPPATSPHLHSSSQIPDLLNRASNDNQSSTQPDQPSGRRRSQPPIVQPNDLQVLAHVKYAGDIRLTLTAEILLDYPMPSFVGIPLKLSITGLTFDGVAVLASIGKRVCFCFLGGEDAEMMVGRSGAAGAGEENTAGGGKREKEKVAGGLLEEIRVESEIGRKEGGKQVLKNVGKVERFVLEQVRRIFEDEFVWPSFWTFLV
jgi:mitochondrial distribution and morphology protein 12